MSLNEHQVIWVQEFTGLAAIKQSFDDETALKRAIIAEVRKSIESNKAKLVDAVTFEVAGRKSLDQGGSQLSEADSTEYGKADLNWDQMKKINAVGNFMTALERKMEAATIKRPGKNGAMEDQPLFTDQEITDELFTPLVRERLLPETLVPKDYSETAKMIEGSNQAYMEDLEEYTKNLVEEEDDLVSSGIKGVSQLSAIGGKLAAAFPGAEAKMAADILKMVQLGTNTAATGYDAIRKNQFKEASGSIIDNIGALMKGILTMAVSKEVAETAGNIYSSTTSLAKVSIALYSGKPEDALAALASGLDSAMAEANKGNKDPYAGAIASAAATVMRNAKPAKGLVENIQKGNFAGVVDGFNTIAQSAIKTGIKAKGDIDKQGKSEKEQAVIDKKYADLNSKINTSLNSAALGLKTGDTVLKAIKSGGAEAAAETMVANLGAILANSLTLAGVDKGVASQIGTAYTSASNGGLAVMQLAKPNPDGAKAAEALGKALGAAISQIDKKNKDVQLAADTVQKGFSTLAKGIDIGAAYKEGTPESYKRCVTGLSSALKTVMGSAFNIASNEETKGMSKEEEKAYLAEQAKLKEELDKVVVGSATSLTAALELLKSEDADEKIVKAEEAEALKRIEESGKSVMEILKAGNESDQFAQDVSSIDKLIADMMKDQMILQMATGIAKGGLAMATKWVPALGVATVAIQMAENLMAAGNRALALNAWMKNQKDLKRAQDALESSAKNFVKNQSEQFSHYSIQAAFQVAQLIGKVLELSGIASAAGAATAAAADAGAEAEKVIYEFYKKATLEAAWKLTQKALRNPKNRRLGLEARALNPTLAKYSIAWSAMVRENPMARNIMNEIGLSENNLRSKGSDVKKVVKFMELKFSDDIQVRKKVDLKEDYMPKPVELNAKCWCLAKVRAESQKEGALKAVPTGALDDLFAQADVFKRRVNNDIKQLQLTSETVVEYTDLLEALDAKLNKYVPVMTANTKESHMAMKSFVEDMLDLTTQARIGAREAMVVAEDLEQGEAIANMFAEPG